MKDIEKFIKALQDEDFVEGHEVLEERWKELKNSPQTLDESKFLKGLINGSTAIALKLRGKEDGAKRVWQTYTKYKPLIDDIKSEDLKLYKEAIDLLEERYAEYFK